MFKKALMKISVIGIVGAAFAACGIVDVEQAQGVVDLRARILEIQTTEVDPLVDQIDASIKWVRQKGRFYTNKQQSEVESLFREGQEIYR